MKYPLHVAVDLTPLLPGGENGGAKIFTLNLLGKLVEMTPHWRWSLLTSKSSHEELAAMEGAGVQRIYMFPDDARSLQHNDRPTRLLKYFSARYLKKEKTAANNAANEEGSAGFLRGLKVDLLFCPFTRPLFHEPGIPVVSVIYDLQYLHYPQFFSAQEREERDHNFRQAAHLSDQLVCISDFVRDSVLQNAGISRDRVTTIHLRLAERLGHPTDEQIEAIQNKLGLAGDGYLFYPANAWPHKNHRMLFVALGMYLADNPQSNLKLVCTGQQDSRMEELHREIEIMKLQDRVLLPGYLDDSEFAALLSGSEAVIFPSLYEGFGMPVVEAMAHGRPVLCSNATSLPEIAANAALYFDPRRPEEIAASIGRICSDPCLAATLIERGLERADRFRAVSLMAEEYLAVFSRCLKGEASSSDPTLHGVTSDHWTYDRVVLGYGRNAQKRHVEIELSLPAWVPHAFVTVTRRSHVSPPSAYRIHRGKSLVIREKLSSEGGIIELLITPVFQPSAHGRGEDIRHLGCRCSGFWLFEDKKRMGLSPPG